MSAGRHLGARHDRGSASVDDFTTPIPEGLQPVAEAAGQQQESYVPGHVGGPGSASILCGDWR
jgi:hypothetical protein